MFKFKSLNSSGTQISETPNGVVRLSKDYKLSEKQTDSYWGDQYYSPKPNESQKDKSGYVITSTPK
jgi:hypothetical protein